MSESTLIIIVMISVFAVTMLVMLAVIKSKKAKIFPDVKFSSMKKGEKHFQGTDYTYHYTPGSKNNPPAFSISCPYESTIGFYLKKESGFDRLGKRLGLVREISTMDEEFDRTYFINTDSISAATVFFQKPRVRETVNAIFRAGFNSIFLRRGKFVVMKRPLKKGDVFDDARIDQAIEEIHLLVTELSKVFTYDTVQDKSSHLARRVFAFSIPAILFALMMFGLIAGLTQFRPLDKGRIFLDSLKYSLPAMIFYWFAAIQLLKGRSASHYEFTAAFFIALFLFPICGFGMQTYLNGRLDSSPAVAHRTTVLRKYYTTSKNDKDYYLVLESWRGKEEERIGVSRGNYQTAQEDGGVTVTTHEGKFGFEWIESIHLE